VNFKGGVFPRLTSQKMTYEILSKNGIHMRTYFLEAEVVAQEVRGEVSFKEALGKSIEAILGNKDHIESFLALAMEEYGSEAREKMMEHLNDEKSVLALVAREVDVDDDEGKKNAQWPPENGEGAQEYWRFCLLVPSFSDHIWWSVVDRKNGECKTYGFN
jgi:hypothetical protein